VRLDVRLSLLLEMYRKVEETGSSAEGAEFESLFEFLPLSDLATGDRSRTTHKALHQLQSMHHESVRSMSHAAEKISSVAKVAPITPTRPAALQDLTNDVEPAEADTNPAEASVEGIGRDIVPILLYECTRSQTQVCAQTRA
jgi:hypothetical protein